MGEITGFLMIFVIILLILIGVLQVGIIRRLNSHEKMISEGTGSRGQKTADLFIPVGSKVKNFDNQLLTAKPSAKIQNATVIAFLLENCPGCNNQIESIRAMSESCRTDLLVNFLVVMIGNESSLQNYTDQLPREDYVIEEFGKGLNLSLQPAGYPAFALVAPDGELKSTNWEEIRSMRTADKTASYPGENSH